MASGAEAGGPRATNSNTYLIQRDAPGRFFAEPFPGMAELKRRRSLDLDERLPFQQREWRASRLLWILLLLTMLATGLGVFGNGPLSHARVQASTAGLSVDYERFGRFGAAMRMTVSAPAPAGGSTELEISRSLLDAFQVTEIAPAPAAQELTHDAVRYRFDADPNSRISIIFDIQPQQRWMLEGFIRSAGETVLLRQFIYP